MHGEKVREGDIALATLEELDGNTVQLSSQYLQLPVVQGTLDGDCRVETGQIGEAVPVEFVDTNGFNQTVRLLEPGGVERDGSSDTPNVPLPGVSSQQRFDVVRANGELETSDVVGLKKLRCLNGLPGTALKTRLLRVTRDPMDRDSWVGFCYSTGIAEWPSHSVTVDVIHKPDVTNHNSDFDASANFSVPSKVPVRYELDSYPEGRRRYSLDQFAVESAGIAPIEGQTLTVEMHSGERRATVHYEDNDENLESNLRRLFGDAFWKRSSYTVELLESAPCDGDARVVVRESLRGETPRVELDKILNVAGGEGVDVGDIVSANTEAGKRTAKTVTGELPVELETTPELSTTVEVRVTGLTDAAPDGVIDDPGLLPRAGNVLTVEYTDRGREVSVPEADYTVVLESPPVFVGQTARVELVGEFDPEQQTIPGRHREYLSHPEPGETVTVTYRNDRGRCVDPETGLDVPLEESINFDGTVEVELQVVSGEPIASLVDPGTVPVPGATVPAEVKFGQSTAVTESGVEIELDAPAQARGKASVEVIELDGRTPTGTVCEYSPEYLSVGDVLTEHLKYRSETFEYDRDTPPFKVHLDEQATETGLFEIEIIEIGTRIRGSVVGEADTLGSVSSSTDKARFKRGVPSSLL